MITPSTSSATTRRQGWIRIDTMMCSLRPRSGPAPANAAARWAGPGSRLSQAWIEGIAQTVVKQDEAEHREQDRCTGKVEDPRRATRNVTIRVREKGTPIRRWERGV